MFVPWKAGLDNLSVKFSTLGSECLTRLAVFSQAPRFSDDIFVEHAFGKDSHEDKFDLCLALCFVLQITDQKYYRITY